MQLRGPYWEGLIRCAWDSGLRRKDLHRLTRADCKPDFQWTQHKTRKLVRVRLRPSTLDSIARLDRPDGAFLWPLWGVGPSWDQAWWKLVEAAGVPYGAFKTLRKSAGTASEKIQPGSGQYLLGNTRREFERHYVDPMQIECPQPPELDG